MTTSPHISNGWWIWCGHIKTAGKTQFVYAMLAPWSGTAPAARRDEISLVDGCSLVVHETVVGQEVGQLICDAAASGNLDLPTMDPLLPVEVAVARRSTIEAVLGDGGARIHAHYTLSDLRWLSGSEPSGLRALLTALETELGLPFRDRLFGHLGNLDVIEFGADPPDCPLAISTLSGPPGFRVEFRRRRGWNERSMLAHLKATSGEEVLVDELVPLPGGAERVEHALPEETLGFDVTLFEAGGGSRLHHDATPLLRTLHLNMDVQARRIDIDDRLAKRMRGAGKATEEQARTRTDFQRLSNTLDSGDVKIRAHTAALRDTLAAEAPDSPDRFFGRTLGDEWSALAHLRKLLDKSATQRAVLIDPFFGEDALLRLLMRLGNAGLNLTVVTSWATTNPDTAVEISSDVQVSLDENVSRLHRVVERLGGLFAPRIRLLNLVRGRGSAFHDRYLLLERGDRRTEIYLLSNSINGMAVNWPFCMSALTGAAARQATDYVSGLVRGEDVTGDADIDVNFDWSNDQR